MVGTTISHYKILEKLGEGGMGVVYEAQDLKLDRLVALKFLPPHLAADEQDKARFIHEAKAASALDHPNICTIYEIGETSANELFIAMALYEGTPLNKKIEKGPLSIKEAIDIATQVADGLQAAHERGIVHRDIKSGNIVVTARGRAIIMDFGLARKSGMSKLTKTGSTLGTVPYMSPEQARGDTIDHRSDIWSLGIVLYEMITGRLPFRSEFQEAVVYSIMNEQPEPPTALRSDVPMELERIVKKTMQKSVADRYQHVEEMVTDLRMLKEELESGVAIQPPKEVRQRRKHLAIYGGIAAFVLILVAGGLLTFSGGTKPAEFDSIAVLPIANLTGDPEQAYYADAMTEELITDLGQVGSLRVIGRQSVMRYKNSELALHNIAEELNVKALVVSSLLQAGDRVRVTAQLIDATGGVMWSQSYERSQREATILHNEIAKALAEHIQVSMTPQETARIAVASPVNPAVYDLWAKGWYQLTRISGVSSLKGLEYAEAALRLDSSYAPAYALAAACYNYLPHIAQVSPQDAYSKARSAAQRALDLDEGLAEAHFELAWTLAAYDWNWVGADREFRRGIELEPGSSRGHSSFGWFLSWIGRGNEALAEVERALQLDPASPEVIQNFAAVLLVLRRYDDAIVAARRVVEIDSNFAFGYQRLGQAYIENGMYEQAISILQMANEKFNMPIHKATLARAYALSGRRREAARILKDLQRLYEIKYLSPFQLALVHTGLGEKDEALRWLEEGYRVRDGNMVLLKVFPAWDLVRADPRYQDLLKRMNFPEN